MIDPHLTGWFLLLLSAVSIGRAGGQKRALFPGEMPQAWWESVVFWGFGIMGFYRLISAHAHWIELTFAVIGFVVSSTVVNSLEFKRRRDIYYASLTEEERMALVESYMQSFPGYRAMRQRQQEATPLGESPPNPCDQEESPQEPG